MCMSDFNKQASSDQRLNHSLTLAQRFVEKVGGIDNARRALERLEEIGKLNTGLTAGRSDRPDNN